MKDEVKKLIEPHKERINEIVRTNRIGLWFIISGFLVMFATLIYLIVAMVALDDEKTSVITKFVPLGGVIIFLILGGIGFFILRKRRRSFGDNEFITQDEKTLFALYESYLKEHHKTTSIQRANVRKVDDKTVVSFFFKNELFEYLFETRTWKKVTGRYGGFSRYGNRQHVYYYVQYVFRKKVAGSDANEGVLIAEINTDSVMNHKSDFESESIPFNKMFNVNGQDLLAITKMFTPKVIDQMVTIGANVYKKRITRVLDNSAGITFSKERTDYNPHFALSDFNMLKFSYNSIINGIIKKIETDMSIFLELRTAVSPFDFGQE
jgi:hypothetical protein